MSKFAYAGTILVPMAMLIDETVTLFFKTRFIQDLVVQDVCNSPYG